MTAPSARNRKKSGPRLAHIEVDGQQVRPRDAMWVVYDPDKNPVDMFPSDTVTRDNVARAARAYWMGDTEAILALNQGYHLELMTKAAFVTNVSHRLAQHLSTDH